MPTPDPTLSAIGASVGLDVGFATTASRLQSVPAEALIIQEQATIIADENQMLFASYALRPSQATFRWTNADYLVDWAEKNGKRVVQGGHLVWDQDLPSWLTSITNPTTLRGVMEDHIQTVVSRYGTRVSQWNVLNEAIKASDGNPGNFRTGHWYNILGVNYARWAFDAAAAVCPPGVKLIYNCGNPNADETAFVKSLLDAGVRVDGVGFQMHIWNGFQMGWGGSPYHVEHMNKMAALGLDIYVTEMDCRDNFYPIGTRDADCATALTYDMTGVFREVERLKHVVWWGVTDNQSWMNSFYPRTNGELTGSNLPYNRSNNPNALLVDAWTRAMIRRAPVRKFPQVPGSWSRQKRQLP